VDKDRVERVVEALGATPAGADEILTLPCDILCPCALGDVIDANLARRLRCRALVPGADIPLDDPDEDSVVLKSLDILSCPSFLANAGGAIRLAGAYLGWSEGEIEQRIADIETTMARVLRDAETMPSTHAAAMALVDRRLGDGLRASTARGSRGRHGYNDQSAAPVSLQ
jgi:leucine dehydrogenase